jgi:hypothetical protein
MMLLFATLFFSASLYAQQPRITVQSPAGGENWVQDSTYKIRWMTMGTVTGTLEVQLSLDSGATWTLIDTVTARAGADSLLWTVDADTTHQALVRIRTLDSAISGRSRRVFSIVDKPVLVLRVLAPNGGEVITPGAQTTIRWTSQYVTGNLVVEYTLDSGTAYTPIATVPAKTGIDSLVWTTPTDTSRRAIVRVRAVDGSIQDASNRVFAIATVLPIVVKVMAPNGGEVFAPDSTTVIRWEVGNLTAGFLRVQYSIDSGSTWVNVGQARQARNGLDTMSWKVPNVATDFALVRVTVLTGGGGPGGGAGTSDTSDAYFSIGGTPAPSIALQSLLGGGRYAADSVTYIRWTAARVEGDLVIEYSTDNRATWKTIATKHAEAGADSVRWVIPNEPTTTAWVRVRTVDTVVFAMSARAFTIVARTTTGVTDGSAIGASTGIYPNPARGAAELHWSQPSGATVRIRIVGTDGRPVADIDAGRREPGAQRIMLDLEQIAGGRYFVEIISGGTRIARTDLVR